jgi:hypothetical protein
MDEYSEKQSLEKIGFIELFYKVLFSPNQAAFLIHQIRKDDSSGVFVSSLLSVLLSSLAWVSQEGSLSGIFSAVLSWFFSVVLIYCLSWLFGGEKREVEFSDVFVFCAFAQVPLIFIGVANLWSNSSLIPTSIPKIFIMLWSVLLWVWALSHSLKINRLKASMIVLFSFLAPVIFIIFACLVLVGVVLSLFF